LGSLEALGLNLQENDIRFVEDDWENPTLGAWGLGWEVWLKWNGNYPIYLFPTSWGLDCKPVLGEITYGLERLAMYLQSCENVYESAMDPEVSYGDVYHQNEVEQSTYNFEYSNTDWLFSLFTKL
jgi:glycyl-tRNA synthetase alpha chain